MKEIYLLKYTKKQTIFADKFIENEIQDESYVKAAIKDFIESEYDIVLNKTAAVTSKDGKVYLYVLSGNTKTLLAIFDYNNNVKLTKIGESQLKDSNLLNAALSEFGVAMSFIYKFKNIKNNRKIKTIKSNFYEKIKIKGSNIEILKYPETDNQNYIVENNDNKITFLTNDYKKKVLTVPSKLYPMPNNNKIMVYDKSNTDDLESGDISDVLSDITFKPGYCYQNADNIIRKIKESKLDYKLDFYSGWMYNAEHMTHHAWVVINDKHVLDVGFPRAINDYYNRVIKGLEKGEEVESVSSQDAVRERFSNMTIESLKSNKPFKEKYGYGKIINDVLYIGVKTNSIEARSSFNELIKNYPDHPDYTNIYSNGSNKTLDLIYKKM